ncbi:MAG: zf-HC2 domain-containing protein [Desulfomonile tiedjei]|nr:zf-HC2 domain-containing protein [Desulfomonile tiedjei]
MSCRKWQIQIYRLHEGELDRESEAALLQHLGTCASCRADAERFSQIDRVLQRVPEPSMPPFLAERIVTRVIEQIREDSAQSTLRRFFGSFAYFRPAVAGTILILGIGLGVLTGLNLSPSINTRSAGSSYDVLTLAGIEGGGSDSSLDFIWTDADGGGR